MLVRKLKLKVVSGVHLRWMSIMMCFGDGSQGAVGSPIGIIHGNLYIWLKFNTKQISPIKKTILCCRCGQIQSGSFLDVAAPNGLFGLGMEKISVPSMLSREGFTADSFSMCFGRDGIGRISFGDKGSFDQDETPFNLNPSQ